MKHPIIVTLAICPYCQKEFRGRDEFRVVDNCYKHIRKMHPETEKDFQAIDRKAAIKPGEVKLLKAGY